MPDDRVLERWFERGLEAIGALTKQVARVAWALENSHNTHYAYVCPSCHSRLIASQYDPCPACGAPGKEFPHG